MGPIGLTELQQIKLDELIARTLSGAKPLTPNMNADMNLLAKRRAQPELPDGAKTFLREWYAADEERFWSKYTDKGNIVEEENIDMMARVLGYGLAEKNIVQYSDEYLIGTPDSVLPDCICDIKSPWNNKTLQAAIEALDSDYEWQLRGYMRLLNKDNSILFYGLQNTPSEVNNDYEISYDHLPENERWHGYIIKRDLKIENEIIHRVVMCRTWLEKYDKLIKSRLGRIIEA